LIAKFLLHLCRGYGRSELPEIADGVRWLQTLAVEMAKSRAAPPPEPQATPAADKGLAGLTGVTVKEYHPGKKK
jgi:hypothetical protein